MTSVVAPARGNNHAVVEIHDDDNSIDESQLAEYQEMVEELGSFPDKVKINSLTMIAEDYADSESSAGAIYRIIHDRLLNTTQRDNILPVVYAIDSILKNVKKGCCYVTIVEKDAINWMPIVYQKLTNEIQRTKLEKVWKTWAEFQLFSSDNLKAMGKCFDTGKVTTSTVGTTTVSHVAGILRNKDGMLILPVTLRKEMQNVLDEIQSGIQNELEKVSLERLADLNPSLLSQIKTTAEESMRSNMLSLESAGRGAGDWTSRGSSTSSILNKQQIGATEKLPSFFTELRSQQMIILTSEWNGLQNWKPLEDSQEVIRKLQHTVQEGGSADSGNRYTRDEALQMTRYLATVSATATLLSTSLDRIQKSSSISASTSQKLAATKKTATHALSLSGGSYAIDIKDFNNEGIKKKNEAVIGLLYEIGLPLVSSADGRRFRTQIELSNHLDALFKRNQLEKSMARTEERGWYVSDASWMKQSGADSADDDIAGQGSNLLDVNNNNTDMDDAMHESNTVPADESRDRCVICGLNFKMVFDNDDGIYKYINCKEIEILNDDAAETESELKLVHVSCWKGLGSPEVLTIDQVQNNSGYY